MKKNIITIDIDRDREEPIRIHKPETMKESYMDFDNMLVKDIESLTFGSLYLASMMKEEDELKTLDNIMNMVRSRKDEITK
jgi:hypothetical protein